MKGLPKVLALLVLAACGGSSGRVQTLAGGETLRTLAADAYGDAQQWPAIWLGTNTRALQQSELTLLVDPEAVGAGATVWIPGSSEASKLMAQWATPGTFLETRCWSRVASYGKATCGYVVVPEDHANPTGRTLQLAVAVVKSTASAPASDPVFVLEGGPGVSGVLTLYSDRIMQLLASRDVVLVDQRGMGHSQPGLFVKEGEALEDAKARLVGLGVDLSKFHTAASAEDLEVIRRALSLGTIDLYSFSYGTFLAQEVLRLHSETIRAAVLDSCLPVSVATTAGGGQGAMAAFRTMAADCAADADCAAAYPSLETSLYSALDAVAATSTQVTVGGVAMTLQPAALVTMLFNTLNSPAQAPYVPRAIDALAKGRTEDEAIGKALASTGEQLDYLDAKGAKISVQCHDVLAFETYADAQASNADLNSYVAQSYDTFAKANHDWCGIWQVEAADAALRQPVSSDVPALILGGEYDSLTRPSWSETVAQTLTRGHYVEVPHTGHVAIQEDCPLALVKAFLDDPSSAPDTTCIAGMDQPGYFQLP